MIRKLAHALVVLALAGTAALAQSTINPNIPAQNSPLNSAPIRGNFIAAANDINNLYAQTRPLVLPNRFYAGPASGSVAAYPTFRSIVAADVPFQQAGTGAVVRQMQSKVREWVSPEDFGAVCDDVTNDALAFQRALDYLKTFTYGGGLRLPAKDCFIDAKLQFNPSAEQSLSIQGWGKQLSVLRFGPNATGGLEFISSSVVANRKPALEVVGVGFTTNKQNAGTAIRASWADAAQLNVPLFIWDVQVSQDLKHGGSPGPGFGFWTDGIYITNARNSTIGETWGLGERHTAPYSQSFIKLDGETTDFRLIGVRCVEWTYGVNVGGTSEGIMLYGGFALVYVDYGFYASYSGGEPQIVLANGHINAMLKNVYFNNALNWAVIGVDMTAASAFNTPPYPDWVGIHVEGANTRTGYIGAGTTIAKEAGRSGGSQIAVKIDAGTRAIISPINIFSPDSNFIDVGIQIANGVTQTEVSYPTTTNVTTPVSMGTGATNRLMVNRAMHADASGNVRIANNVNILARNAADTAYIALIGSDSSNNIAVGSGSTATVFLGGVAVAPTGDATINFGGGSLRWNIIHSMQNRLYGSSSGAVSIVPQAAAGTYNFNLPTTAGTSGQVLTSGGGAAAPMTWTNGSMTVNGQTCTLGSSCTITAVASDITVGTTTVTGGTNGRFLAIGSGLVASSNIGWSTLNGTTLVLGSTSSDFGPAITGTNTAASANGPLWQFTKNRGGGAVSVNDYMWWVQGLGADTGSVNRTAADYRMAVDAVGASSVSGRHEWLTSNAGTIAVRMILSANGRLAIGSTAAARALEVISADSPAQMRIGNGTPTAYDIGRSSGDGLLYFSGLQTGFTGYVFSGVDGDRVKIPSTGGMTIGTASLTLTTGALGLTRIASSASAPGAGGGKLELVCGTNAGTAKLQVYAGTNATPQTVLDNIGSGVTGC